jgi:malate dehydrogenase (oxaloacetate-decarboxylating)(NADP+)
VPKAALVSSSNFGTLDSPSAIRLRRALALIRQRLPALEIDGEMHADAALNAEIRRRVFPGSVLEGEANLLVLPTLDSAHIAFNLIKTIEQAVSIGPILMGVALPAHIVTQSATVRGLVNMTAIASVGAAVAAQDGPPGPGHDSGYFPAEEWTL